MTKSDVLDFAVALQEAGIGEKALLVGNGFSVQYFGEEFKYGNLLELSNLEKGTKIRNLFDELKTVDFENVIRRLEDSEVVARTYWGTDRSKILRTDAIRVREALVEAIGYAHPKKPKGSEPRLDAANAFLEDFNTIYCLNYDLLLYWVALNSGWLDDGFPRLDLIREGTATGPYIQGRAKTSWENPSEKKRLFFLHGCLNLYTDENGDVFKILTYDDRVIDEVSREVATGKLLPLYVAEGTSRQKLAKIRSNLYLRDCHESLLGQSGTLFVYGHRPSENDAHIYEAIFRSNIAHVFFGVHGPTDSKVTEIRGELSKRRDTVGSDARIGFYDSGTAGAW